MSEKTKQAFFYPVVKEPTGRMQFRLDRAEVVTIDRLGEVHRGQVVSIGPVGKPPTPKALDFARGLVVTGNFSHVAADTPLGVPSIAETAPDGPDLGEKIGDFQPARGDEAQLNYDAGAPLNVARDFEGVPPNAHFTQTAGPLESAQAETDAANREHLSTFDGTTESVKKSTK